MSIFESKGCQELRSEEIKKCRRQKCTLDHPIQVLWEENILLIFFTNLVFFFEGEDTIFMSYHILHLQVVVSALSAHSLEGVTMIRISINLEDSQVWLVMCRLWSITCMNLSIHTTVTEVIGT